MLTPAPNDYAGQLAAEATGPYDDATTIGTAKVIAEGVRYLNYAVIRGGVTEPATIYTLIGELSSAAYRMPQLLSQLGEWLSAEARADRIADDHGAPAWQFTDALRDKLAEAGEHAGHLAAALAAAQSVTSTLHSTNRGDEQ